jgi:hypothetical protein
VRAVLDDPPRVEHADLVHVPEGREPVGDQQGRAPGRGAQQLGGIHNW